MPGLSFAHSNNLAAFQTHTQNAATNRARPLRGVPRLRGQRKEKKKLLGKGRRKKKVERLCRWTVIGSTSTKRIALEAAKEKGYRVSHLRQTSFKVLRREGVWEAAKDGNNRDAMESVWMGAVRR